MLTISFGNSYVNNEQGGWGRYQPYSIPSEMILRYTDPACLVDLFDEIIELSC